jgi:glycosyltransferase involved in cell wall biosynthesis
MTEPHAGSPFADARKPVLLGIVTGVEGYGVFRVWTLLSSGFAAAGWKVVIAILEGKNIETWRKACPDAEIIPSVRSEQMVAPSSGRWSKLFSMARRARAQLAHLSWLTRLAKTTGASAVILRSPPETLLAGLVARRTNLKAYWLVPNAVGTNVPFRLNQRIYRFIFRNLRVVPVSNSHFTDSTFGKGAFERHVVHLGVDTAHFLPDADPVPVRQELGIPADVPVIGLFARMIPFKGQRHMVDAIAESGTPFRLLLCGGPTDRPYAIELIKRAKALGIGDRVHMVGPQSDLRPYYAACDVIANMRVDPEPFGLTVIEAMAAGKPVFAHRAGGPSETILDGRTGWLLPDVSIQTIASGLKRIMEDRNAWPAMGRAARDHALGNFRKERFIKDVEALVKSAT